MRFLSQENTDTLPPYRYVREGCFIDPTDLVEPGEQRFASRPGKRFVQHRFFAAGGLADQHHLAVDGLAGHGRCVHGWALPAGLQGLDMLLQGRVDMCLTGVIESPNMVHTLHTRLIQPDTRYLDRV